MKNLILVATAVITLTACNKEEDSIVTPQVVTSNASTIIGVWNSLGFIPNSGGAIQAYTDEVWTIDENTILVKTLETNQEDAYLYSISNAQSDLEYYSLEMVHSTDLSKSKVIRVKFNSHKMEVKNPRIFEEAGNLVFERQ